MAGGFESEGRGVVIGSGGAFEDGYRALEQLFVFGCDVHHQVAVDIAKERHGGGGDCVEDHFVGGASFHARRSSENFGADLSDDGEVGGALERRVGIAGQGNGAGAATASFSE